MRVSGRKGRKEGGRQPRNNDCYSFRHPDVMSQHYYASGKESYLNCHEIVSLLQMTLLGRLRLQVADLLDSIGA